MIPFNTARHEFGKTAERDLKPYLESLLGEELTQTESRFDTMDFVSKNYFIELKARTAKYHWETPLIADEGWLIPTCKIDRAKSETKKVLFFYFWKSDHSLWKLEYSPETFSDLRPRVPWFHSQRQLHYFVPQDRWELVSILE
jgi:hypothetical protein